MVPTVTRFRLKTNSSRRIYATTSEPAFPAESSTMPKLRNCCLTELLDNCLRVTFQADGETSYHCLEFESEIFGNIEGLSLGLYGLFPEHFVPFPPCSGSLLTNDRARRRSRAAKLSKYPSALACQSFAAASTSPLLAAYALLAASLESQLDVDGRVVEKREMLAAANAAFPKGTILH